MNENSAISVIAAAWLIQRLTALTYTHLRARQKTRDAATSKETTP